MHSRDTGARYRFVVAATVAASVWLFVLIATPFAASGGRLAGVGTVAATAAYATGRLICHQRPERSFHPWGSQMPVCARCAGLYAAAPFGALLALYGSGRRRHSPVAQPSRPRWSSHRLRMLLIVAAAPTVVTVLGEAVGLVAPTNLVRAVSALPLGCALAWSIGQVATAALDDSDGSRVVGRG